MIRRGVWLGVLAALVCAPAAAAQDRTIQAVDGTDANEFRNHWTPENVTIRPGDTVTWSFAGTSALHNVMSTSPNWSFRSADPASGPPPASYTFPAQGTYTFFCEVHTTTMKGTVSVTDASGNPPPPPPPPPLSEQPFPNDAGAPSAFEVADALGPRLSRVRVRARHRAARLRFRIDEPAVVTVRVQRARVTVKRRRGMYLKGTRTLMLRGLPPGDYRLTVVARDLAGNRSRVKRARVTVR